MRRMRHPGVCTAECSAVREQSFIRGCGGHSSTGCADLATFYQWPIGSELALPGRAWDQNTRTCSLRWGDLENVDAAGLRCEARASRRAALVSYAKVQYHGKVATRNDSRGMQVNAPKSARSEEHTSELQSLRHLV